MVMTTAMMMMITKNTDGEGDGSDVKNGNEDNNDDDISSDDHPRNRDDGNNDHDQTLSRFCSLFEFNSVVAGWGREVHGSTRLCVASRSVMLPPRPGQRDAEDEWIFGLKK